MRMLPPVFGLQAAVVTPGFLVRKTAASNIQLELRFFLRLLLKLRKLL